MEDPKSPPIPERRRVDRHNSRAPKCAIFGNRRVNAFVPAWRTQKFQFFFFNWFHRFCWIKIHQSLWHSNSQHQWWTTTNLSPTQLHDTETREVLQVVESETFFGIPIWYGRNQYDMTDKPSKYYPPKKESSKPNFLSHWIVLKRRFWYHDASEFHKALGICIYIQFHGILRESCSPRMES